MRSMYRSLLLTLAVCSAIVFVISGQTWVTATLTEADVPTLDYLFSGRELEPIIGALAIVPAVGVVALIAAKGLLQRIIGFIIFVCGTGIAYLATSLTNNLDTYVENLIANKVGRGGIEYVLVTNSLGPAIVAPAAGVALVGLVFTIRNFDSAKKKAAYDQPEFGTGVASLTPWQALDSGYDPTISVSEGGTGTGFGPGSS